ncbi:MAG: hypothetical protein ABSB78_07675 [Bacteroidota bacterium]
MTLLEMFATFLELDTKDHENFISMLVNLFLLIIGLIFLFFVPGWRDIGIGMAPTAFIALIPLVGFFIVKKLERMRDVEGVLKVALRKEPLFNYLKPELENEKEICLLGSILQKDFFRQIGFKEIMIKRKDIEGFKLRLCIYSPSDRNEYLELSIRDQNSEEINQYLRDQSLTQKQRIGKINKLIQKHKNRMITNINDVLDTIGLLKREVTELKDKIEIRTTNSNYILDSILIVGNKVVICDYLHQRENHPFFVLKSGPVSEIYKKDFERVWSLANVAG